MTVDSVGVLMVSYILTERVRPSFAHAVLTLFGMSHFPAFILVRQILSPMDNTKLLKNVLSAQLLIAAREVTDCLSTAVLKACLLCDGNQKKHCKVQLPPRNICKRMVASVIS